MAVVVVSAGCGSGTTSSSSDAVSTVTGTSVSSTEASATTGSSAGGAATEIRLGMTLPLSGPTAIYGKEAQQGAQLAAEQLNAGGGIGGSPIKLLIEDSAMNPTTAVSALQKLISVDKVCGIVCTVFSSEAMAEAPILTENKMPMILGPGASPSIPKASDFIFMPHPTSFAIMAVNSNYAYTNRNLRKMALLGIDNESNRAAFALFQEAFESLGGEIVLNQVYPANTTDFKTILSQVKASGADSVCMSDSAQSISRVIQQAAQLGVDVEWMASSEIADTSILETVSKLAPGAFYPETAPATAEGKKARQDFLAAYTAKYGAPKTITPYNGYDALMMMAQAIEAVGTDGTKIKEYLENLKDFAGVTGEISFNGTNVAEVPMFIHEEQGGAFVQTNFSMVVK